MRCVISTRCHFLSVVLIMALLLVSFAYVIPSVFAAQDDDVVIAGVPANFPPQYQVDAKTGKPYGFAIDVMDEVARRSGIKVRYVVYPTFPDVMVALQEGEIDLVPNLGITQERMNYTDFTAPVETFHIHIFLRANSNGIENIDDLTGRKVAVVARNQGYVIMKEHGGSELLVYNSMEEALMGLISGNADAMVYPEPPLLLVARQSGIEDRIKTAGDALAEIKRSIGVRKGQPELYSKLDETVKAFILTPEYQQIYVKWYSEPEPYWNTQRVALLIGSLTAVFILFSLAGNYYAVKKINADLKESKNYIETIIKTSVDGIFVVDGEGKFEFGNEAFSRILGWPQDELIGESFLKVLPADQHEFIQMRWKEVQEGKGKPYETVVVTKDGVRLNIFASHRDMQIRGETKYVVVIKDITEFKHNEEALRQSEDKFSKAFHATPDAIIITRVADMQLIDVNKVFERLTGYSRDEALGHTSMELDLWANPKDREKYFSTLQEQGYVREQEARFRMRSGEIMDGLVSGEAFDLGDKMHILTIIRDITQRKQAEEELRKHRDHLEKLVKDRTDILTTKTKDLNDNQLAIMATVEELESTNAKLAIAKTRAEEADRLKSVFLATMSHELRTPLNSIIGFTGIMLQGFAGPLSEEQEKQLGMVKNSARHLLALINDVLDISKIEAGQLKMDLAPFQMHEAIDNAVKIVTPLVQKQGLGLHVEVSSEVGEIISDQRRVEQILLNLLGNAIKFTEKGGLKIECHIQDNQIITNITDTGLGIKSEYMDNLFKPFVQLENGITRRFEGTGLGLSISNKLVEMLGGRIWVESEFGKGSVFTFTLPIKMGDDMA